MEAEGWIKDVFDWVQQNPNWTGLIIFGFSFLESLLLVGIIFPGAAFLVSLGALIGLGVLDFYSAWFWASFGGFCGDGLSYWIGYYYREKLLTKWPINRFPNLIENGQRFFKKYGIISIIIGRFVGPVRPIIPAIVGIMGMPIRRYLLISLLASILWAPFYLLPGILFGSAIESMAKVAVKLAGLTLVLAALIWLIFWLIQFIYQLFVPRAYRWLSRVLSWSQKHPKLGRLTSGLVDPRQPETGSLAMMAFILALLTVLVIVFMAGNQILIGWNQTSEGFFYTFHNPWTLPLMQWFLYLGHDLVLWLITVFIAVWLIYRRLHLVLSHWLILSISAYIFSVIICRIDHGQWHLLSSHHVFWYVAVTAFWAILVAGAYPIKWRSWPYILTAVLSALYIFAILFFFKLTLQIALLSGIMAAIWAMVVGIAFRTRYRRQFLGLPLKLIFLIITFSAPVVAWLIFPGASHIQKPQWLAQQDYSTTTGWANTGKQELDIHFNGELTDLQKRLQKQGWQVIEVETWANLITALAVKKNGDLPVLSYVHKGELEHLLMTKPHNQQLWALRVWPESASKSNQWSATVTRHKRDTDVWFFHHWGYVDTLDDKTALIDDFKNAGLAVTPSMHGWQVDVIPEPQNSQ
ncbi:DedA family protein [Marinicella gelatinilytica]|uniref:DedA family protein n=1 Tax=Marinicella gelatinilytica TaxID=2996017 RepID=UPI002260D748|nr:DedA family protein [Marinicella gelatinilytica]MCX7545903.1 DedA family protein [Marinicella gelatinilytica]